MAETLRNQQLCLAHIFYLESIREQIRETGSRGGSIVLSDTGDPIHPKLSEKWRSAPENEAMRNRIAICTAGPDGMPVTGSEECRAVPEPDGWFETVWKDFREGKGMLE